MSSSQPSAVPARASERSRRDNLPAAGREGVVAARSMARVCVCGVGRFILRVAFGMSWLGAGGLTGEAHWRGRAHPKEAVRPVAS